MKKQSRALLRAPWSNQQVGLFVRSLAWVFFICGIFSLCFFAFFSFTEVSSSEHLLSILSLVSGIAYLCLLFGHIALKGRAPAGWLPWIQY